MTAGPFVRIAAWLAAVLVAAGVAAQEEPRESGHRERVRIDLAQIEVTVWPEKESEASLCLDLTADDFEITVNGRARELIAVDWLGSRDAESPTEADSAGLVGGSGAPEPPPLTMVLFFDLWHLDLFYRRFECPMTKALAFEQARELVRDEFRTGDRLLLVTFAGWPRVHEGWIRNPVHAMRALDRLEVSPQVLSTRTEHSHHQEWIGGIKSLMLALGRYPGRKEVFYLADDFRFDDVALQVFDLAARAQANEVTMHAVDLLATCRSVPGPGCPDMPYGGLGCTDFRMPIALGYVAANTGGALFDGGETIADSVNAVRRMRGCRYLLSFPITKKKRKHAPKTIVRVKRKGVGLQYPSSFGNPRLEPTERERQDALFLLPRFGRGIHAEVGLWPLRPSGKRNRWRGVMIARVSRAPEDPWPDGLTRIELEAIAHTRSVVYEKFRMAIEGEELGRFRDGDKRLFVFPLDRIRPGPNTSVLHASGIGGEVTSNVRTEIDVPEPPGPGEAGPWFLVDRPARVGKTITVVPALDGVLALGRGGMIVGYGCREFETEVGGGRLVALDADRIVPIPVDWLDAEDGETESEEPCGWLAGRIEPDLGQGLWRFEPPVSLRSENEDDPGVEFRVAPADEAAY
jgi:hypothetical protein